jgi:hypothetical protein
VGDELFGCNSLYDQGFLFFICFYLGIGVSQLPQLITTLTEWFNQHMVAEDLQFGEYLK